MSGAGINESGPEARMLADIGGTHARFAWQPGPGEALADFVTLECAEFARLADAVRHALARWGRRAPPECAIAIATAVSGDHVRMTNLEWEFSIAQLRDEFGFRYLKVLNDFSALAHAVPTLSMTDLHRVGGGTAAPDAAIAVLGPGTGLGVSGLIPDGRGGWRVLESEGGHTTLSGSTALERDVLAKLAAQHTHVSAERVLSGQGLVNLHAALWSIMHPDAARPSLAPAAIAQAALVATDEMCLKTVDLFCAFLGGVAGNLALTLGARGGVYLGGGIVPRLKGLLAASAFRARFESKGRLASYLAEVPVFVIDARESPALRGAAQAL